MCNRQELILIDSLENIAYDAMKLGSGKDED